jgi:hypothetical protein
MSGVNLEDLSIHEEEEEGFVFDMEEEGEEQIDFRWCLIGRFLSDRTIHVNSMKVTMADIWRPVKGVKIKEATPGLFLFQFAHALDMEAVLQGGPWMFDNHMLILERVQLGVQIENIPLHHVDFWVQVHDLPVGFMVEKVGKKLANYIGVFVEYDKNNKTSFWRQYMRIRVRVDVRQPLKKESKVKNQGGEWCTVKFKYERLGVFCFVCGIIGHAENKCEVRFAKEIDDGVREWSNELRAEPRRRGGRQMSRWLREEGGSSGNSDGGERNPAASNSEGPTRNHDVINDDNNNQNHTIMVPIVTPITNVQNLNLPLHPAMQTDPSTFQVSNPINQQLMSFNALSQPSSSYHESHTHKQQTDKHINSQLSPNHEMSVPYFQFTTAAALNTHPILSDTHHQKPINIPLNRTIKFNPNPTQNRTIHKINRPDPNSSPSDPNQNPNRNVAEDMEVQTEKKRRRNEERKENSDQIQHFLAAGPGSQDCRDQ